MRLARWWVFRERRGVSLQSVPRGTAATVLLVGANKNGGAKYWHRVRHEDHGIRDAFADCGHIIIWTTRAFSPEITALALWQVLIRRPENTADGDRGKNFSSQQNFARQKHKPALEIYTAWWWMALFIDQIRAPTTSREIKRVVQNFATKWICWGGESCCEERVLFLGRGGREEIFLRALCANCPWHNQSQTNVVNLIWISREQPSGLNRVA